MNLGENILKLRKSIGLSQEILAEKVGVTRQTISNWELGETSPNPEQLKLLSKTLNVSVDELLDNDIKEILVEKVSNTEKLAGIIIKILKAIGIIFIVLLVIDFITLILFNVMKTNYNVYNEKTIATLECTLDGNDYEYIVEYDNDDNIISASGSEFIDNLVKDKNIEFGTSLVKYIEKYFEDNGGSC